jgi:hypothetical protein
MRFGSPLRWFNKNSTEYIYGMGQKDVNGDHEIYDYRGVFRRDPCQWIELVGRILYRETKSIEFSDYVVEKLAVDYGVDNELRSEYLHPMGWEQDNSIKRGRPVKYTDFDKGSKEWRDLIEQMISEGNCRADCESMEECILGNPKCFEGRMAKRIYYIIQGLSLRKSTIENQQKI